MVPIWSPCNPESRSEWSSLEIHFNVLGETSLIRFKVRVAAWIGVVFVLITGLVGKI